MADETSVAPEVPDEAPAPEVPNANGSGQLPAGDAPKVMTLTQEQFDAMVKDRLDRAAAKAADKAKREQSEAEAKALAEQGKYEDLYKAEVARREAIEKEANELRLAGLRKDAAAKHKLPASLAERLKGETAEELEADAQALAAMLPKPGAPGINATEASMPPANTRTEANRKDFERAVRRM
jgi:hypothetical protein